MNKSKLNIWNILHGCARGLRLYCTVYGYVYFRSSETICGDRVILIYTKNGEEHVFNEYGQIFDGFEDAECILFPDYDMRDWERFNPIQFPHDLIVYASDNPQGPYVVAFYSHYDYNLHCHVCFGGSQPKRKATFTVPYNYIIDRKRFNRDDVKGSLKYNIYNLNRNFLPL